MFRIMATSIALALASPCAAEPIFQGLEPGATEAQVLSAFPAARVDDPASKNGKRVIRFEGHPSADMWTNFIFYEGGLASVQMNGRGAARYLEIVENLKAKYGKPNSEAFAADSGLAIWNRGSTTITARLGKSYSTIVGPIVEPFKVVYEPLSRSVKDAL